MVVLRRKLSGMWLFFKLFVCVVYDGLLGYYVLDWALWIIILEVMRSVRAIFLKFRGTNDRRVVMVEFSQLWCCWRCICIVLCFFIRVWCC